VVIEEKADMVRRMFALSAEGLGISRIADRLHREYPQGLTGKGWQPGYIRDLLRSRSVIGEYQPHIGTAARRGRKKTRKPVGDPVKSYFPAVVTEALFYRVQEGLDGRRTGGGRTGGAPNLFNGILYDFRDGKRMVAHGAQGSRVLVSSGAIRRQAGSVFLSINYPVFEKAILGRLKELTPADVMGKPGAAQDRVAAATGRLVTITRNLDALKKKAAEADDVTAFLDLIADLDRRRKAAVVEMEKAEAEAAAEGADNLGEFTSLASLLDEATPEERPALRARIRAALRRVVEMIYVQITRRGKLLNIHACVWFKPRPGQQPRCRTYNIVIRSGSTKVAGGWLVEDWTPNDPDEDCPPYDEGVTAGEEADRQVRYLEQAEWVFNFTLSMPPRTGQPDWRTCPMNPMPKA
jgi:hypothetical protein